MPLLELEIQGYRSVRRARLSLNPLNVITGPNGSGKSNLYRGLWLMSQVCEGNFAQAICREGGFLSALWAGPKKDKNPVRMSLGFRTDEFSFSISCGFPPVEPLYRNPFRFDPEIKEEFVWHGLVRKPSTTLLERKAGITRIRDIEGKWVDYPLVLAENESVLSQLREPHRFPELFALREELRGWRFYHAFRTDEDSPMRYPRVGVRTPVLSHDGSDFHGKRLGYNFIDFITRWSNVGCFGPEDWQFEPFHNGAENVLELEGDKVNNWKKWLTNY